MAEFYPLENKTGFAIKEIIPETEIFVKRKDISEFLQDGKIVADLYKMALKMLTPCHEDTSQMLDIMNAAYRICWTVIWKQKSIFRGVHIPKEKRHARRMAYAVAWSLLSLQNDVECDASKKLLLDNLYIGEGLQPFLGLISYVRTHTRGKNMRYVNFDVDGRAYIQKMQDDGSLIDTFSVNVPVTLPELEAEVDRLYAVNGELEEIHKLEMESKDAEIQALRAELKAKAAKYNKARREAREWKEIACSPGIVYCATTKEMYTKVKDPIDVAVSFKCITEYIMTLRSSTEISTILTMLHTLFLDKGCHGPKLKKILDGLRQHAQAQAQVMPASVINVSVETQPAPPPQNYYDVSGDYIENMNNNFLRRKIE